MLNVAAPTMDIGNEGALGVHCGGILALVELASHFAERDGPIAFHHGDGDGKDVVDGEVNLVRVSTILGGIVGGVIRGATVSGRIPEYLVEEIKSACFEEH